MAADTESYFSSWSSSLRFVLAEAAKRHQSEDKKSSNLHVSILDTTLISKDNVILSIFWAKDIFDSQRLPDNLFEVLIYGIVDGPGYCAVPYSTLTDADLDTIFPPGPEQPQTGNFKLDASIEAAKGIADLYTKGLKLSMATYLLSLTANHRNEQEQVIKELMDWAVPRHWRTDKKLTRAREMEVDGLPDAAGAAEILQHRAKYGPRNKAERYRRYGFVVGKHKSVRRYEIKDDSDPEWESESD